MKIALLTIHGLVRAENVELGRDPDTGGQIVYVLELAKALAQLPIVEWVQVWTKSIKDDRISPEYCQKVEPLLKNIPLERACIVRIPCMGSEDYIPKELMWDQLDLMVDAIIRYAMQENKVPDVVHSHYADAGHSLGRTKLSVLQTSGMKMEEIESQYQMTRRIESEECCLDYASLIVTSTADEIESQWGLYDQRRRSVYVVIPPGIDLTRFHPPIGEELSADHDSPFISRHTSRFLTNTDKKVILMICRPDKKKNIENLIRIYGRSEYLRTKANLVLILGNRSDVDTMDIHSQEILLNVFKLIDLYDLYGNVMYPKQHEQHDIPEIYRYAASRKGVFVNISWFEPFGLTLLESAASGLPVIATCRGEIERAILSILDEPSSWENFMHNVFALFIESKDCTATDLCKDLFGQKGFDL
ncbi:Probable sucrose-phosphate synthase 1 [Galdieria sulphuraria]|nr:Probable sucrose-phosphate synthase 1 [Galdieria sulphuraria]